MIIKGDEPASLRSFKRKKTGKKYDDLTNIEREDIRSLCTQEQYFLCAYCCQQISGENGDTMNEHVVAQALAPQHALDFSNIVASCRTPGQCDAAHGSQPLPLTPLMHECETELQFKISGRVEGKSPRARETIRVLKLGDDELQNKSLIGKRKALVEALMWQNGVNPEDGLEDEEQLRALIVDLQQPRHGKLQPFSPVLVNILHNWISG